MKNYIAVILTLIFITLVVIGAVLYSNFGFKIRGDGNSSQPSDEGKVMLNSTADTETIKDVENESAAMLPTGIVSGEICYPSEGIPPLTIYLKEVNTGEVTKCESELNQSEYDLEEVPLGTYVAYAYVSGIENDGGGYTQAVECGLAEDCTDHTLIEFDILESELTTGVNICDWYGAEIPEQELEQ